MRRLSGLLFGFCLAVASAPALAEGDLSQKTERLPDLVLGTGEAATDKESRQVAHVHAPQDIDAATGAQKGATTTPQG